MFVLPRAMLNLFFFPSLLVSSFLEFHGGTYLDISVGGKKARLSLRSETDGWRRKAQVTRRSARQTRGVGSGEKGWGEGVQAPQAC